MDNQKIAQELVKLARDLTAESGVDRLVGVFDRLEARWSDESEYEDFKEYVSVAKKAVQKEGFTFVSLKPKPMKLAFRDKSGTYLIFVKGSQLVVEKSS